mgnify:CR=1 FL=1
MLKPPTDGRVTIPMLLLALLASVLSIPGCARTPILRPGTRAVTTTPSVLTPVSEMPTIMPTTSPTPDPSPTPLSSGFSRAVKMHLENGQEIRLVVDERLFTLLCAWNLGGYDTIAGDSGRMHSIREDVREHLQGVDPSLVRMVELKVGASLYRSHLTSMTIHIPYAFSLSPPPDFEELQSVPLVTPGFNAVMRRLYTGGDLDALWKQYEDDYEEVLHGYEALIPTAFEACNTYLRLEEGALSKPIVVAPTLMLARGCGLNRETKDTIFIVLGPTQRPSPMLLQHEYLHQVVGPMIDAQDEALSESEALFEWVGAEDDVFSHYGSWSSVVEESLVRGLSLRLQAQRGYDDAEEFIETHEPKGFLLMGTFYEGLEEYESQDEMSFEEYLPRLLEGIDVEREREAWEALE